METLPDQRIVHSVHVPFGRATLTALFNFASSSEGELFENSDSKVESNNNNECIADP